MRFKTGDLAEFMGMTNMGILYLEKQGVIQSERMENGYRTYSLETVTHLGLIRSYERLGFSLSEAQRLTSEKSDVVCEALKEKKRGLLRQLEIIRLVEKRLAHPQVDGEGLALSEAKIVRRPEMYYCPYWESVYDMETLPEETRETMRKIDISWLAAMPYMCYCSKYTRQGDSFAHQKGNRILKKDAQRLGVLTHEPVETVPSCECLHYFYEGSDIPWAIDMGMRHLAGNGLQGGDPVFAPILNLTLKGEDAGILTEIFIPCA